MRFADGQQLATQTYRVTRVDLVRYAGASGDFNPIHWSDRVATSVGLPGVIAHGMVTLALAGRAVQTWLEGDAQALTSLTARFSRPVVVPDDDAGAEVVVDGRVTSVSGDTAAIELSVTCEGRAVLTMAAAVVRC